MESVKNNVVLYIKRKASLFAKAGKNVDFLNSNLPRIGSSASATNRLMNYSKELRLIMPSVLGLDPSDVSWGTKVVQHLHSFSVPIPFSGKHLDLTLNFDIDDKQRKDYINTLINDTAIEIKTSMQLAKYCVDKGQNNGKVDEFNILQYATPTNAEQYLLYLYCLVYRDVANSIADVDKSSHIRFYIHREQDFVKQKEALATVQTNLSIAYGKIVNDAAKIANVYYLYNEDSIFGGLFDKSASNFSHMVITLSSAISENPKLLLSVIEDKDLVKKGRILKYIAYGIMSIIPNTTTILANDGTELGKNLSVAVEAFDKLDEKIKNEHKATFETLYKGQ